MWGLGLLRGLAVSMRNMLRGPITIQYPEQRPELPERARWAVAPVRDETGAPRCTACLICVKECPDDILHLEISQTDEGKRIDRYWYEMGACMMCGLCVEACPFSAIEMSHEYELAQVDKAGLVRDLIVGEMAASPKRDKAEAEPASGPAPEPAAGPAVEPAPGSAAEPSAAAEEGELP